jgi:molybdate transport system substrate-binding protein
MYKRRFFPFTVGLVAAIVLSAGLRFAASLPVGTQANATLLISTAASLKESIESVDASFRQQYPAIKINHNFGASGTLQQQIEQGAPADAFISAAEKQMNALQNKGLILTGTRQDLLANRLVLVVPSTSTIGLKSFQGLTSQNVKRIAVGEPRSVPAGQYALEVFANLGILKNIQPKLVYGNSVRNVLSAVESGNADAGVVYVTDAKVSKQVTQVAAAPSKLHSPIIYPVAVLKNSRNVEAAKAYVKFLKGPTAQGVFKRYGFGLV